MTAIREAKNLETLQIDQLMGSLLTHEIERKESPTLTIEEPQTKKAIVLKISSSKSSFSSNEDLALFSNKFKKFFKSKQKRHKPKRNHHYRRDDQSSDGRREVNCYNCN